MIKRILVTCYVTLASLWLIEGFTRNMVNTLKWREEGLGDYNKTTTYIWFNIWRNVKELWNILILRK